MPIQKTKFVMSHAQPTGLFKPQTPTPVEMRYAIQENIMSMTVTLMMNAGHHHFGVGPSTIPAILSEIQPRLRRFKTSGSRSNSTGGAATFTVVTSAISALLSSHHCELARKVDVLVHDLLLMRMELRIPVCWPEFL